MARQATRAHSPQDQKQLKRTSGQQTGNRTKSFEAFDPYARRSSLGGARYVELHTIFLASSTR